MVSISTPALGKVCAFPNQQNIFTCWWLECYLYLQTDFMIVWTVSITMLTNKKYFIKAQNELQTLQCAISFSSLMYHLLFLLWFKMLFWCISEFFYWQKEWQNEVLSMFLLNNCLKIKIKWGWHQSENPCTMHWSFCRIIVT